MGLLTPDLGLFVWTIIAFLIVLFILGKFAWKPILGTLNERETKIADSIATAEKVQAEMAMMKSENETLLAQAREERSLMLKEAKEMKQNIIAEAQEQAKIEANKIIDNARFQINNEKNAALVEVKNEVGKLAVEVAEKILRKQLAENGAQDDFVKMLANEIKLN